MFCVLLQQVRNDIELLFNFLHRNALLSLRVMSLSLKQTCERHKPLFKIHSRGWRIFEVHSNVSWHSRLNKFTLKSLDNLSMNILWSLIQDLIQENKDIKILHSCDQTYESLQKTQSKILFPSFAIHRKSELFIQDSFVFNSFCLLLERTKIFLTEKSLKR